MRECTFAQCMLGAEYQKYTTLAYTPRLGEYLDDLKMLRCKHKTHPKQAGNARDAQGRWESANAAAYPPGLNMLIATALYGLCRETRGGEVKTRTDGGGASTSFDDSPHSGHTRRVRFDHLSQVSRWDDRSGDQLSVRNRPLFTLPACRGIERTVPSKVTRVDEDESDRVLV